MHKTILNKMGEVIYSDGYEKEDTFIKEGYTLIETEKPVMLEQTEEGYTFTQAIGIIN